MAQVRQIDGATSPLKFKAIILVAHLHNFVWLWHVERRAGKSFDVRLNLADQVQVFGH
jgi:hypothetical protein